MRAEGRDGGEGADREPEEERWREMEMGAEEERRQGEEDQRERWTCVRWVLKGRDGAWRRWVVRDEEEMMMGCCVREMAARGA